MSEDFWLWAWGAVGALFFAGPALAFKLNADPSRDAASDVRRRRLAVELFWFAVITGSATAQVFAGVLQDYALHVVRRLPLSASALTIGVSANFLWPKIVKRMGEKVDGPKQPGADQ